MDKAKIGLIGLIGEETKNDFWGAMQKVAEIGYQGVEGARELLQGDVKSNVRRFHELGLKVITYSAKRAELRENVDTIISNAHALAAPHVSVWGGGLCNSKEGLLQDAEIYNTVGRRFAAEGLKLCYHNHEHEFKKTYNGLYALDILAEYTDPQCLYFELDVAWATFGGADPVALLHRMAGRVPAIHVKDLYGLSERGQFTAVGTGVVNVKGSVAAAIETGVDWVVVEQDRLRNLTAWETLTVSYLNLKEAGLV